MSRNEVDAELKKGGKFEGWRYTTREEVGILHYLFFHKGKNIYEGVSHFFKIFGKEGTLHEDTVLPHRKPIMLTEWSIIFGNDTDSNCQNLSRRNSSCLTRVYIVESDQTQNWKNFGVFNAKNKKPLINPRAPIYGIRKNEKRTGVTSHLVKTIIDE